MKAELIRKLMFSKNNDDVLLALDFIANYRLKDIKKIFHEHIDLNSCTIHLTVFLEKGAFRFSHCLYCRTYATFIRNYSQIIRFTSKTETHITYEQYK